MSTGWFKIPTPASPIQISALDALPAGRALATTAMRRLPALVAVLFAVEFGMNLQPWIQMWILAVSLFAAAKYLTVEKLLSSGNRPKIGPLLIYVFLWPGMEPRRFCAKSFELKPHTREWVWAMAKTVFGSVLIWGGPRWIWHGHPLEAGWLGMIGIVFLLHFGLFDLVSGLWRSLGFCARPIMRFPLASTSLSALWGGNWNSAFTDLANEQLFKPLAKKIGITAALFATFLVSGVLHELVISVPARAGYGLPTLYFAAQGVGVYFERTVVGRRLGLGEGWRGWCFVAMVSAFPSIFLFHPAFIRNVILPMLQAASAL